MGQSLWKASEVNYDLTLPFYIGKHDTLDSAKVVVGSSIALWVLVQPETACCLAAFPAGRFEDLRLETTRPREAPNLKFLRIAPKPPCDLQSQWGCQCDH